MFKQCGAFFRVDPALKQLDILGVVLQDMQDIQPIHKAVFQVFDLFAEHDRIDPAIGVHQRHAGLRLLIKYGIQDRQDRRDAGSTGKTKIVFGPVRRQRRVKAAHGLHRFQFHTGHQIFVGPCRKRPAGDLFYPNLEDVRAPPDTDGIGPAQFDAVKFTAKGQILPLNKAEVGPLRRCKADHDRIAYGFAHMRDSQLVEKGHGPGSFRCI